MNPAIFIRGLRLSAHLGVPDAERGCPQEIEMDVAIEPRLAFSAMEDDVGRTVDYEAVARRIVEIASERPRHLIETLASDVAGAVMREFSARAVSVEIRKFILPQTAHVAVCCRLP